MNSNNTCEFWSWISASDQGRSEAASSFPPPNPPQTAALRLYSSHFTNPTAYDIEVTYTDGVALSGGTDTELISIQVVDANGEPALYSRGIYVTMDNGAAIDSASSFAWGGIGASVAVIQTNTEGYGWVRIKKTVGTGIVNFSTAANGTTAPGGTETGGTESTIAPTGGQHTLQINFVADQPPRISSAENLTFDEGTSSNLTAITITDSGSANITAANEIRIRIPDSLDAVFDQTVNVTLTLTNPGTIVGRLDSDQSATSGSGVTSWSGTTLRYPDTKTVLIDVFTGFVITDILTVSGLRLTTPNSASTGYLEVSADDWVTSSSDDKLITIRNSNTFIWTSTGDTNWATGTNWTPASPPTANSDVVIPANQYGAYPTLNLASAGLTLKNLRIDNGTTLNILGSNAFRVTSIFNNEGTFSLLGTTETVTLDNGNDTNSGTVEYTGANPQLRVGTNYYNLRLAGSGTCTATAGVTVGNNLTIESGNTLAMGTNTLGVTGDITGAGSLTANSGQVSVTGNMGITNYSLTSANTSVGQNWSVTNFSAGTGTLTFTGTTASAFTTNSQTFAGITINKSAGVNVNLSGTLNAGSITMTQGTLAAGTNAVNASGNIALNNGSFTNDANTVTVGGNFARTSGAFTSTGTLTFNGTADQTFNPAGSTFNSATVNIANSSDAQVVLNTGNLTCSNLSIIAGAAMDVNGRSINATTFDIANGGELYRTGAAGESAPTDTDSGTIIYESVGTGTIQDYTAGLDYCNLVINAGSMSSSAAINVAQDLFVSGGSYTNTAAVAVGNDLAVSGGTFTLGASATVTNDVLISNTATLVLAGYALSLEANFSKADTATFTHGNGTVQFTNAAKTSQVTGTNIFYNFTCIAAGKTIQFQEGVTQTIAAGGTFTITGASGNLISLDSMTALTQWLIDVAQANITVTYADITDSRSVNMLEIDATNDVDANCFNWLIVDTYNWDGSAGTNWNTAGNWSTNKVPGAGATVNIPGGPGNKPVLANNVSVRNVTLSAAGATLTMGTYNLTIAQTFTNTGGTLILEGSAGQTFSATTVTNTGTTEYTGASSQLAFGYTYYNLRLNGSGTCSATAGLTVNNNLTIESGNTLAMGTNTLGVSGSATVTGSLTTTTGNITIGGNLTAAGSVSSSSSGTISVTGNITGAGSLTANSGQVSVTGDMEIATYTLTSANTSVGRDWSVTNFTAGMGTLTFTGGTASAFTTSGETFAGITINKSAGATTVTLSGSLTTTGNLTMTQGTFATAANALSIGGNVAANGGTLSATTNTIDIAGDIALAGGTFNNGANVITLGGNLTHTSGSFTSTGTLTFDGGGAQSFTPTGSTFAAVSLATAGTIVTMQGNLSCSTLTVALNTSLANGTYTFAATGNTTINGSLTTSSGPISVGSNLTGTGSFTSGSGAVAVTGNMGIATYTLTSTNTSVGGDWSVTNFTSGSGTLSFSGGTASAFTTGGETFAGITINKSAGATTVTLSGALTMTGNLTMTQGTFATAANALSIGGNVAANGGTLSATTNTIDIAGDIALAGGTFNNGANTITLGGNFTRTSGSFSSAGTLTFNGSAAQAFNPAGSTFTSATVRIENTSATVTLNTGDLSCTNLYIIASASLDANGRSITVSGSGIFDNADGGILYRTGTGAAPRDGDTGTVVYRGATGGTVEGYGTNPDYHYLVIQGTGTFTAAAINVNVDLTVSGGALTTSGALSVGQDIIVSNGTLTVGAPAAITRDLSVSGGTVTANADIGITRDLVISGGTVTSGGGTIGVTNDVLISGTGTLNLAGYTITVERNFSRSGGTFTHGNGTVEFTNAAKTSQITGANTFYGFVCNAAGKTIVFPQAVTQTIAAVGRFRIFGTAGNLITLQSTSSGQQWFLAVPGSYTREIQFANIIDSNASVNDIYVPDNTELTNCTNWYKSITISASFTRDADSDGKIDAIEFQCSTDINNNFGDIVMTVSGRTVGSYDTGSSGADNIFVARFGNGPALDTGATPAWQIVSNTLLQDSGGNRSLQPAGPTTPSDGAAPVIGYTLAIAGSNQIYIATSEPIVRAGGGTLINTDFSYDGANASSGPTLINPGVGTERGYLLAFTANVDANDVYAQTPVSIAACADAAATPNAMVATSHRVTDVGLGIVGNALVQPVWARTPPATGTETINTFDGTASISDGEIELEAHIDDAITAGISGMDLHYDVDVSASSVRNGIWLPSFVAADYNGIVPAANTAARPLNGIMGASDNLWDFTIPGTSDPEISNNKTVEFVFELTDVSPPLYTARCNPAATNWYATLQPWSFRIRTIGAQKANVNILNNVFNPSTGEVTTLTYELTKAGNVTIHIFDLKGDIVYVVQRGRQNAGNYSVTWDGRNKGTRIVAPGVYFIKIVAPGIEEVRKILVVR